MGSTVEDNRLRIEKFGGQNFRYWMMQIEDYLYQKDLFLPLQGEAGKPEKMDDDKWKVLDRKALATIRLNLHQHVTYNVSHATTTKELMEALEALYEKPSASNKVYLMKKLFNLKMQQGARVADFLNEFQAVVQQLAAVDLKFDNEIQALLLLSCLPDSWENMVMAVSNANGNDKMKLDTVVGAILDEESRRKVSGAEASSSGSALHVEARWRAQ